MTNGLGGDLSRLPPDLLGACLLFLDTRSLLQWRAVATSNHRLFASSGHAQRHLQRLLLELHHSQDSLQHSSGLAGQQMKPVAASALLQANGAPAAPARKILNIGHKGADGHVHGNTLPSFHRAVSLGVDMIEFDVVACADGVLCHHDALFEATGQWFQDMTVAEVKKLLGSDHCTLEEMLADRKLRASGVHLYFDMKHTNIVRPTMRAIIRAVTQGGWCAERIIVATFKQIELLEINAFRRAIPELRALRTAAILDAIPISLAKDFEALGCAAVSVGQYCVCPEFVSDCHRRGLQMWAWTVNQKTMVAELLRLGIDGVCTDYPELVTAATAAAAAAASASASGAAVLPEPAASLLPANEALRVLSMVYNVVGSARAAAVAAISEARAMSTALAQQDGAAAALAPAEAQQLEAVLAGAEATAHAVLQPMVMSAETFKWMVEVIQSEVGRRVMAAVAQELEAAGSCAWLLPFEKRFLASASNKEHAAAAAAAAAGDDGAATSGVTATAPVAVSATA